MRRIGHREISCVVTNTGVLGLPGYRVSFEDKDCFCSSLEEAFALQVKLFNEPMVERKPKRKHSKRSKRSSGLTAYLLELLPTKYGKAMRGADVVASCKKQGFLASSVQSALKRMHAQGKVVRHNISGSRFVAWSLKE